MKIHDKFDQEKIISYEKNENVFDENVPLPKASLIHFAYI